MIPIRDDIPSKRFPWVTLLLIAANVTGFFLELSQGKQLRGFLLEYGLVPARFLRPEMLAFDPFNWDFQVLLTPFSSMFLHGGLMHLLSNVWTLWIFGDNVEDRMGRFRYLLFYLLAGLAAGVTQVATSWGSRVPVIGASGAIAGVMGAYFLLYPHARVLTLVPVFVFLHRVELPAFVFLGIWFLTQLWFGAGAAAASGVAWWAHIGGFACGLLLCRAFVRRERRR